jgi:hypothetical protein
VRRRGSWCVTRAGTHFDLLALLEEHGERDDADAAHLDVLRDLAQALHEQDGEERVLRAVVGDHLEVLLGAVGDVLEHARDGQLHLLRALA